MAKTLVDLRDRVLKRLGDTDQRIWSAAEIDASLRAGYRELALASRIFWDMRYLENLPAGFSYTAAWEKVEGFVTYDYGLANFTLDDERRLLDEYEALGPANHTCPREATGLYLDDCGASTSIPATVDLPETVLELERATWDEATIDASLPQRLSPQDSRYELTEGEVFGYTWRKDGMRTFRKVRKPAAQADTYEVDGSWGLLRGPDELMSETRTPLLTYSEEVLADSPLSYLKLDETAGPTAADSSGNGRTGTYNGSGWTYGVSMSPFATRGTGIVSNGSAGTYLRTTGLANYAFGTGPITVELWARHSTRDYVNHYLCDNKVAGTFYPGIALTGRIGYFYARLCPQLAMATGVSTGQVEGLPGFPGQGYNDTVWHHIIAMFRRSPDRLHLYVDNVHVAWIDKPGTASWNITSTLEFDIGRYYGDTSGSSSWIGGIAHWAIYNTELSEERIAAHYNAAVTEWGLPRRIPSHHPMGTEQFGAPRRPHQEGKNVRVEYWRTGRLMVDRDDLCELPDRYALYLCEYAQAKALSRNGPGQDVKLAGHFNRLWQRGVARVSARGTTVLKGRVGVLGAAARTFGHRPPRPRLPWQYGRVIR